jgi:flagellar basal-body rod protein FlgB
VIGRLFDTPAMRVLSNAMAASRLTHEVVAHNLANVNTPGFKRTEVLFAERLRAALSAQGAARGALRGVRTDAAHLPIGEAPDPTDVRATTVVRAETSLRPDGNNVDLEAEMVRLQENTLLYGALAQLVRSRFAQLRTVINEGRR